MKYVLSFIGFIIFIIALITIYRVLNEYSLKDILEKLTILKTSNIVLAIGFTFLTYLNLVAYDGLSTMYLGKEPGFKKLSLVSFIGFTFSKNIGLNVLTGSSVRMRLYSSWGFSTAEIAKVILMNYLTFWLGFCFLGGTIFVLLPLILPDYLVSSGPLLIMGLFLLLAGFLYLFFITKKKRPLKIGKLSFPIPSHRFTALQCLFSTFDWLFTTLVIYFLLPRGISVSFLQLLSINMIAQLGGIGSQVPGGIGVFEAIMLSLLSRQVSPPLIMGSLIAYRGIFYIFPFLVSSSVLGYHEINARRASRNAE